MTAADTSTRTSADTSAGTPAPAPAVRLALTAGDPSGIGPELLARVLTDASALAGADGVVLSDEEELERAAEQAGLSGAADLGLDGSRGVRLRVAAQRPAGGLPVARTSAESGRWAMDNLAAALDLVQRGEVDAVVFAPLNKSSLHLAGMGTEDELRWFEQVLGSTGFTSEVNVGPGLWTSRVTSHVALAEVSQRVVRDRVVAAGALLDRLLRESGVEAPQLGVCALNPHAGESGRFGRQELDEIVPAVADLVEGGVAASGPFPCDTIFLRARAGEFDGVVTMYHDQGQIAMKLLGFDGGVTLAGGLDVPITTPAHGTAFDRVGSRSASPASTLQAVALARRIAAARRAGAAR